jgi:hypothetical protein
MTARRWIVAAFVFWHGLSSQAGAQTAVPDPTLTPGAVRTRYVDDVCSHGTNGRREPPRTRGSEHVMRTFSPASQRA